MIWYILLFFEIISIVIFAIMSMYDGFSKLIPNYYYDDKNFGMIFMTFLGGWLFMPYLAYLAYKYYKMMCSKDE